MPSKPFPFPKEDPSSHSRPNVMHQDRGKQAVGPDGRFPIRRDFKKTKGAGRAAVRLDCSLAIVAVNLVAVLATVTQTSEPHRHHHPARKQAKVSDRGAKPCGTNPAAAVARREQDDEDSSHGQHQRRDQDAPRCLPVRICREKACANARHFAADRGSAMFEKANFKCAGNGLNRQQSRCNHRPHHHALKYVTRRR